MIRDRLLPILKQRYREVSFEFGNPPQPVARLDPPNADVGELQIYDDGDEATVYITEITHGHFNPYDQVQGDAEREQWIVDEVIKFLDALFDDRVLLYRSSGRGMGGWTIFDESFDSSVMETAREYFVWSGPVLKDD